MKSHQHQRQRLDQHCTISGLCSRWEQALGLWNLSNKMIKIGKKMANIDNSYSKMKFLMASVLLFYSCSNLKRSFCRTLSIIFLTYVLSWITMICTQHINTIQIIIVISLRSHPNIKYHYCTIFHSILLYNIYLHQDIYCDSGLPYYTHLITLTNHIFILFSWKYDDDVLFLCYNHLYTWKWIKNFSRPNCNNISIQLRLPSGKQRQVYRAAHISSLTNTLNTTYSSTHNNKQL